jgi:hypothetical protein
LVFGLFVILKLFSRSEIASEESGLPILVSQRGNDHYFRAKPQLNSETFFKPTLRWEERKQLSLSKPEVAYGKLNVHVWEEICGHDLNSLKNHVLFPKFPSRRFYTSTTLFTHGTRNYDYGERIFGYLRPKSSGIHKFHVLGKSIEVWIGQNADPSTAKLVYQDLNAKDGIGNFEMEFAANNIKYYIEILHKKGKEDGDFALRWKIPGGSNYVELSGLDITAKLLDSYLRNGEVDGNGSYLEIPNIHRKIKFPILSEKEQQRNNLFKLAMISDHVVKDVLTRCKYKPSYIVDHTLTNYKGVWETHYNSLYPIDETNVTRGGWVCLGNDELKQEEAVQIVGQYMKYLEKKHPG